jgi:hypothetical protein
LWQEKYFAPDRTNARRSSASDFYSLVETFDIPDYKIVPEALI